ncbi:DsbA family oxidoreductase [Leeuwenhoekiella nanhaiensis]|uniref:Disulfide bond formation protein DsbA n=1 Tax=Leeuwenhoekiella nanhaiensis TaxID=1655491 RepID=A0A2G1VS59_9FLAO|nr:DsbA family oxidoreductase [Leeuwenhoekiella nanhaiensis]PHQ29617.1 disulfide bond formation protein DsbA [Leeuwenhoekiella nanhaiensis]
MTNIKMKVEIWSDIMCPFCYIGKRKFDNALEQFSQRDNIEVIWKSFDLAPGLKTDTSIHSVDFLQKHKGMSEAQAKQAIARVTDFAKETGLDYDYDKIVVANTHRGHQLIHLAGQIGLQDAMKERLLKAYFIEGRNVDDVETLVDLGQEVGLEKETIESELNESQFAAHIEQDIAEARNIGVNGVPFFVFDRKYAVSGAQPEEQFLNVLQKSYSEWYAKQDHPELEVVQGTSCDVDGNCD